MASKKITGTINGPRKNYGGLREREAREATVSVTERRFCPERGSVAGLLIHDLERDKLIRVEVGAQELRTEILEAVCALQNRGGPEHGPGWGLTSDYPQGSPQQKARAALETVRELRRTLAHGVGYHALEATKEGTTIHANRSCGLYRVPGLVDRALAALEAISEIQEALPTGAATTESEV